MDAIRTRRPDRFIASASARPIRRLAGLVAVPFWLRIFDGLKRRRGSAASGRTAMSRWWTAVRWRRLVRRPGCRFAPAPALEAADSRSRTRENRGSANDAPGTNRSPSW